LRETQNHGVLGDAWIQVEHDDQNPYFDPESQDLTRTVTVPGTGMNTITVGSYDARNSALAQSSSRGPTTDGRLKPDLCAPGVGIMSARPGARAVTACSDRCLDTYVTMEGTSMAAPHVTGIVALMFQRNPHLTYEQARAELVLSCRAPDPITAPTLPNINWGAGKVDAEVACAGIPHASAPAGPRLRLVSVPPGAMWPSYIPTTHRLKALRARLGTIPSGELLVALVSTHFDEVLRLVNSNERVALAWHRLGGPLLIREAMAFADGRPELLPAELDGRHVEQWLGRMLDQLALHGSPGLRRDVAAHRSLALAIPGRTLAELEALGAGRLAG
jgi:hypothetical protein